MTLDQFNKAQEYIRLIKFHEDEIRVLKLRLDEVSEKQPDELITIYMDAYGHRPATITTQEYSDMIHVDIGRQTGEIERLERELEEL